ncbi:MAG: hypothetical protein K9N06_11115 [Candidatus Cloacimonetes bacterium]|nr:hypothetical protein [Candidatus Cloacimonadota bacterium]
MEEKYLKDFIIILVVILLLAFGIKTSSLYKKVLEVSEESEYKKMALSEQLLQKIQQIDSSIQDRKNFVFTVDKDPLEQNLIVKTQKDLEMQWRDEVENMVRLEMTVIPDTGEKKAAISYKGSTTLYGVGDKFDLGGAIGNGAKGEITDIRPGEISYLINGKQLDMQLKPIPPKPASIKTSTNKAKSIREYNW